MAEAIFRSLVVKEGLSEKFVIDSAGTAGYHIGKCPDDRTIKTCKKYGVYVDHFCKQISDKDLDYYDFVIAMDLENLKNIKRLVTDQEQSKKVFLMREFSEPGQMLIVDDPYYGNITDFEETFKILTSSCTSLLNKIKERIN